MNDQTSPLPYGTPIGSLPRRRDDDPWSDPGPVPVDGQPRQAGEPLVRVPVPASTEAAGSSVLTVQSVTRDRVAASAPTAAQTTVETETSTVETYAASLPAAERDRLLSLVKHGADLNGRKFPPLRFVVDGIMPEGLGLLIGAPKAGKSWAALGIALAIAYGGTALGGVRVEQGRVLYLAMEDSDRRIQDRCRRLLDGQPIPDGFDYVTIPPPPADVRGLVATWLDQYPRGVVIIDTLGKVMPPALGGESAYERDYRVVGTFKRLADEHPGSAVIIVHHDRKASSEDFVDAVSGTHGLAGAADFIVVLDRKRNETAALLKVTGRDVPEHEYAVDIDQGRWTLRDGDLADAAAAAAAVRATAGVGSRSRDVIAHVLAADGPVTPAEVAAAVGIDAKTAGTYLRRAVEREVLTHAERGLYAAPPPPP
ncbi:AAA family ATPase [Cellulosimicrobium sp. NPDC055967]|uniref:AAA family ATPase n=1 Tax=Cellulosimicrobium sp. NPDC055967 TaxID=3345670 RepID=UPI0035DB5941